MRQLEIGDNIYRYVGGKITIKLTIARVTKKYAFTDITTNNKFSRTVANDGEVRKYSNSISYNPIIYWIESPKTIADFEKKNTPMKPVQLITIILLAIWLQGCMSYERAVKKYGTTVFDTLVNVIQVPVVVPHDSVITTFKTDTTYYIKEEQQGRARVQIIRTPQTTVVRADCDSTTIIKEHIVRVPVQSVQWGVNKWYKYGFWIMVALFAILALSIFLAQKFTFKIDIQKKLK